MRAFYGVLVACFLVIQILFPQEAQGQPANLSCTPPLAAPEISALARALNYDLVNIYEYIYYNVDFLPTYGSKKGALGTYLDRSGNNFDQNVLFVELLRQSCISASYRQGTINFAATMIANLFGVQNDVRLFIEVLSAGGIGSCVQVTTGTCVTSGSGPAANVALSMVWTEATVGTTIYRLDPSLKSHTQMAPIDVASAMGYNQTSFLTAAQAGSSTVPGVPAGVNSIRNLNRANITSQLNTYSGNLTNYIKANNPSSSSKQILGGRQITNTNFGLLLPATGTVNSTLPASFETVYTVTVSNNPDGSSPMISATVYGSQIGGRRLTLAYNGTTPTLALEGTVLGTGTATAAATQTLSLTVQNPYPAGATYGTHTVRPNVKVGGMYAVMLAAGDMGRDTLTRHQMAVSKLVNAGTNQASESVRGELLAAIGSSYVSQSSRAKQLITSLSKHVWTNHEVMGVAGFSGTAAYVDFPAQLSSISDALTSNPSNAWQKATIAVSIYNSTLESTAVQQMQKDPAVSTVRMFDYANSDGTGFAQVTTPTNMALMALQQNIVGWSNADLTAMNSWLTANPGGQIILPLNGLRTVQQWKGSGFYEIAANSTSLSVAYIISGGYNGGFGGGFDVTPSIGGDTGTAFLDGGFVPVTRDLFGGWHGQGWVDGSLIQYENGLSFCIMSCFKQWDASFQYLYPAAKSFEPINLLTGSYTYDHEDINVGSTAFPFGLSVKRSYDSANFLEKGPVGYGWRHNLMMSANIDSDSFESFGDHNPLSAVPTAVAAYTIFDLMSFTTAPSLNNTVIASLSASWLMDQLVRNSVTVTVDGGTKKFIKIPTSDGKGVYVPPPGDASTLLVNTDNTITLTDKSKVVATFDADGKISSWKDTNNNTVTFTYTGTGGGKLLQSVNNGMGRVLTFTYNASQQLTQISDGARSVGYAYDAAGNLATYTDSAPTPAQTRFVYDQPGRLTQIFNPSFPSTAFVANVYDDFSRVKTQTDASGNTWFYLFANGTRSQEIDPANGSRVLYYDGKGNQTLDINQVGDPMRFAYDGIGRLIKTTYPNSDSVALTYDANHNVLTRVTNPVPGSTDPLTGLPATPITESWTYDSTFNKVLTATDGRGNLTTRAYDTFGNLSRITQPAVSRPGVASPVNPISAFTYGVRGLVATATDPEGQVTVFTYDSANFDLRGVTKDSGTARLNLLTTYTYDVIGNLLTLTNPKGNVSTYAYDGMRRTTQVAAPAPFTASVIQFSYDADGRPTSTAHATGNPGSPWLTETTTYNASGKTLAKTASDGTTMTSSYDSVGRLSTVTSSSGRRVRYIYDAASRILLIGDEVAGALDPSITVNLGTVTREMRTYFSGGLLAVSYDGKSNATRYSYDGFKRVKVIAYPDDTPTLPDFEIYGYDANSNLVAVQTRSGAQIRRTYDALNRVLTKTPSAQAAITYGYDYTGRMLNAKASTDTVPFQFSYDTAGRLVGESSPLFGAITATVDANGNRTSLVWPPSATYTTNYTYDQVNRLSHVFEPASGVRFGVLSYNTLAQRTNLAYGPVTAPVASTSYTWTPAGQVASLAHSWSGSALNLTYSYNMDHQRSGLTASDGSFLASTLPPTSVTYTTNSLNQYATVSGTAYTYDKRGNLTSDGLWTYGYDTENRLISAARTGTTVSYAYDALGRRKWKTVNGVTTAWASFGDQEIAEYQGTSTISLTRRFIYGSGLDEPIASVSPTNVRTYYFSDALGSVIALTNASGLLTEKYAYTAYGQTVGTGANTAAYRYTGRRWDAETGLYHYRGRAYSPIFGRFLQTDPIGTAGGLNLYAYVGNDPLNLKDPTGCWVGMDDFVFAVGGAIVGIAGQLVVDGITKHEVSSTRDIIAAGVGGAMTAWSALYTVPTMGPAALYVAGGVGGAATNLAGQAYDSFFDANKGFNGSRFAFDTAVGFATGIIPRGVIPILMPTMAGVNAGRNSFNAIFNQMTTKAMNGQISSVTFDTALKMFGAKTVDAAFLTGALVSSGLGVAFDVNFAGEAHAETAPAANHAGASGPTK